MATKKPTKRTSAKKPSTASDSKVTRITASDDAPRKSAAKSTAKPAKKTVSAKTPASARTDKSIAVDTTKTKEKNSKSRRNPLHALTSYFRGAWYELTQVRWPDRQATWGMTGALIAFTLFFVIVITLLDALFQYLFNQLVK